MNNYNFQYTALEPIRLDVFVAAELGLTRSAAAKLIEEGNVLVNGKQVPKSGKLKQGDSISVLVPDPKPLNAVPEEIPLEIVYEDEDLLVVNKPKGMVVHPAPGNYSGTLVNALMAHCNGNLSNVNGVVRPGIVHRIDKDTSGLLIVAKNDRAHNILAKQIKEHSFTREYEAVVCGILKADEGEINLPIGRHPIKRKQMAVTNINSKQAITHYKVLARLEGYTYVRLKLFTGRTHQIRVHMAYIGHPVAGDTVYGGKKASANTGLVGQCLHAKKIGFVHPTTNQYLEFESALPEYFKKFLSRSGYNGTF